MKIKPNIPCKQRQFEIPYNFDLNYLKGLEACGLINDSIRFIYIAPFHEDYQGVNRINLYREQSMSREEYVQHMTYIRRLFKGKMQLLLQNKTNIMSLQQLKWYIDLGFTAFCCGNLQQAKMIKEYNPDLTTIASIVLHTRQEQLKEENDYYKYFDIFVLDFSFCRNLPAIKNLPFDKKYMLLANAICNTRCDGDHHWFVKDAYESVVCPGKYDTTNNYLTTTWVRPMDLKYFDPYIEVYKLQDRSWPTADIIRNIILYTQDYSNWPGIEYNECFYEANCKFREV